MGKYKYPLLGLISVSILLSIYYGQFIANADYISFGAFGDGYKNYYTLAYYLKNDSGAHFSGMNYPYGENVIYTDNQPLIAWLLKPITKLFPSILNHIQAIIIWLLVIGYLITYWIIYRILLRFKLPSIFAALFSVFIVMLSPQIARLNGHFSLGYTFFIPLLIWLLICLTDSKYSPRYLFYMCLLLSAGIFVHPYYFAISALFILSLSVVMAVGANGLANRALAFAPLISIVVAFALFKTYIIFTDSIVDRPSSPWGFVMSRSTIADILLHPASIIYSGLIQVLPKAKIVFHGEGTAYIGILGILTCVFYLLYTLLPSFKRKLEYFNVPNLSTALFIASIPVLLFAMAFPFSINPWFESLFVYMPSTIKQFRAAGRFSWVFYYVASICTAILFYRVYVSIHRKWIAVIVLGIGITIWFIDVNTVNIYMRKNVTAYKMDNYEQHDVGVVVEQLAAKGCSIDSFQAILPIPFFLNGSEKIYIETPHAFFDMRLSNVTGLPIVGGQMSRTSIAQTFRLANLFSGPYVRKDILLDFNNAKPLLMYVRNNDKYTATEVELISRGKLLYENGDDKYYILPLDAFGDSIAITKQSLNARDSELVTYSNYQSLDSVDNVIIKTFDDQVEDNAFIGGGALYSAEEQVWLYGDTLPNAIDGAVYEVSLWMYADKRVAAFPVLYVNQVDVNGNEIEKYECEAKFSTNTYNNWVRADMAFTLHSRNNKIYISGSGEYATYDELMIRPIRTNVVTHKTSSDCMYNNFPIY